MKTWRTWLCLGAHCCHEIEAPLEKMPTCDWCGCSVGRLLSLRIGYYGNPAFL